mgnify:CR=1 FL=1
MIIDLEGIAHKLTTKLYGETDLDEVEKAKIEYGLSLTLGVGLALVVSLGFALVLGTVGYTLILFASTMALRIFSGGAHCTSYDRCLALSLLVFVPGAYAIKVAGALPFQTQLAAYAGLSLLSLFYLVFKSVKLAALVLLINALALGLCYLLTGGLAPQALLSLAVGIGFQTAMLTRPGQWLVGLADKVLKFVVS